MRDPSNTLVIYVATNRPGEKDGTTFEAFARLLAREHGIPSSNLLVVDTSKKGAARRAQVAQLFGAQAAAGKVFDGVAFLMHGAQSWLQTGHAGAPGAEELASLISRVTVLSPLVVLYACLAGTTGQAKVNTSLDLVEGSFAELLHAAMVRKGSSPEVLAHTSAGHTTLNPYVVKIGDGWDWVVSPASGLWQKWRQELKAYKNGFWARFPWMSPIQLLEHLDGAYVPGGGGGDVDADPEPSEDDNDPDPEVVDSIDQGGEVPHDPFPRPSITREEGTAVVVAAIVVLVGFVLWLINR